ncbi:MAG: hypothetical protein LAO55_14735 [Acidobacteriia bacterium]|nr:hypothetical protein [Terriglobia bacterium]
MKRILYALVATATLTSAQGIEARGKKVVDDAIAALGGQKFLNMQDRIEKGRAYSFFHDQISGLSVAKIYTRYIYVAPDRTGIDLGIQEREAFGKNEDYYVLFRQEGAWEVTFRGPKELEKDRVQRYRDTTLNNVLYIFRQRLHEPGIIFESQGSDVVENQPVDVVNITDSHNRVVRVYFHQTTKLPVQQSWVWRDPETKEREEEVTRFSRYRQTGGIQWPQQMRRERNGEKVYEIFSESVTMNQELADNLFAVPGPDTKPDPPRKK